MKEETNKNMKFYRYEAREYAVLDIDGEYVSSAIPNPRIELRKFDLIKETPKGYWIGFFLNKWNKEPHFKRWVSKTTRKRFAYPTKEEALTNYIKRTERRIKIMKRQILVAEIALGYAKVIKIQ